MVFSDMKNIIANLVLVQPACGKHRNIISEKGAGGGESKAVWKFSGNSSISETTGLPKLVSKVLNEYKSWMVVEIFFLYVLETLAFQINICVSPGIYSSNISIYSQTILWIFCPKYPFLFSLCCLKSNDDSNWSLLRSEASKYSLRHLLRVLSAKARIMH